MTVLETLLYHGSSVFMKRARWTLERLIEGKEDDEGELKGIERGRGGDG